MPGQLNVFMEMLFDWAFSCGFILFCHMIDTLLCDLN